MGNGTSITYQVVNQTGKEHHQLLKTKPMSFCQKYENVFQDCLYAIKESTNQTVSICVPVEMFENLIDLRKSIYYAIFKLSESGYKSTFNNNVITIDLST